MELLFEKLAKLAELIGRKHLPAKIDIAWLTLRALLASSLQLPELRAYCHQNMHWMDLLAIICFSCIAGELLYMLGAKLLAGTHRRIEQLNQRHIQHTGVAKATDILQGPDCRQKDILTALLQDSELDLNPSDPAVKSLASQGIIVPVSLTTTDPAGTLHTAYSLSLPLLQEVETHRRH